MGNAALKTSPDSKNKARILVVDDNAEFRSALTVTLANAGFWVLVAGSGREAVVKAEVEHPHLILLDKGLPDGNGFDVCRELKSRPATAAIPIIFLSGHGEDANVINGLDLGAEDFIAKPFQPQVLLARVRAVLKRVIDENAPDVLSIHMLQIDRSRHRVLVNGQDVHLTATELKILLFLARKPGWVFSRQQIVEHLNDGESVVTSRSVDVQVAGLRKKLGPDACHLVETVRSVGYRILEP
jgi:two-component system alkaline phosphatase synthesis response regulator PhoP